MAGKDVDHEEFLVGTVHDALPSSGSDLVDQCFGRIDQFLDVFYLEFAE